MNKIVVADKRDITDGTYKSFLFTYVNADIPILLLSRVEDLQFSEEVLQLAGQKFCVVDVIENGWDNDFSETLVVGENTMSFFEGNGWQQLHDFIKQNPPAIYLKRELLEKDICKDLLPIEYPNFQPDYALQLKDEFNNRPISALNYWGRSHEARLVLHGEIWKNAAKKGYTVCDNLYQVNHFMHHEKDNKNKWLTFHIPFYDRQPISEIMKLNAMSKLSISLFGCGQKCFRHAESPNNSIMVLPEDNLAWTYEWEHGVNCIRFKTNGDITGLKNEWDVVGACEEALKRDDLYDIYLRGSETNKKYRAINYAAHISNLINNA